tara:strand:+ start:79 stop:390 length:312 start_codon:yes stop_codon:yes gene_type:complete
MKLDLISARIDKDSLNYVDRITKQVHLDRSTIMRQLLRKGIEEDKKERAVDLYSKGKLSIEKASKFAGVYIGEFFELLRERGVNIKLTVKDYDKGLKNLKKIF